MLNQISTHLRAVVLFIVRAIVWVVRLSWPVKIASIAGVALIAWLAEPRFRPPAPETPDYKQDYFRVSELLSQAETAAIADRSQFEAERERLQREGNARVQAAMKRLLDSLRNSGSQVTQFTVGQGTIPVQGKGRIVSGEYEDPWIRASVRIDTTKSDGLYGNEMHMSYGLTMTLHEVTAQTADEDGKVSHLYSVYLRSTKDTSVVWHIGDYKRVQILQLSQADERRWFFNDFALSGDLFSAKGLEAGLSFSPFTFTSGGMSPDKVVVRFPSIGVALNLQGTYHVHAGVRVNVAHWLPLFRDLYLVAGYGIGNDGNRVLIGIGTTL